MPAYGLRNAKGEIDKLEIYAPNVVDYMTGEAYGRWIYRLNGVDITKDEAVRLLVTTYRRT